MKTQILRLDPNDDLISTRDKMNWGQTGRILLVWPEQGHLLRRRVDLVLLQRHSASLGAQLALVTNDALVREHARLLAIPIFSNLRQAQDAHWRVERRRRVQQLPVRNQRTPRTSDDLNALHKQAHNQEAAWLAQPAARVGIFTVGVLAVLALAAVLLPGAEVHLNPQTKTQEIELTVRADPAQEKINLSGVLPAHLLRVVVEGRDSLEAAGVSRVPDQAASGGVVFTNLSDQPLDIPSGLVVRTPGDPAVRFATLQTAHLDAGPGITATLAVSAITPGTVGNLPPHSLTAIEGDLGLVLEATNPKSMRGGTNRVVPMPTEDDRQRLYENLESALRISALKELQSQLSPGDLLFTPTLSMTQVLEQVYDPAEDQPAGQLTLSLRVEYRAFMASNADLRSLTGVLLDANLPEGYIPQAETLAVDALTPPFLEKGGMIRWDLSASRRLTARIKPDQAIQLILGVDPQAASRRLSGSYPLKEQPAIRLVPSWWPRLPILPFRITIVL